MFYKWFWKGRRRYRFFHIENVTVAEQPIEKVWEKMTDKWLKSFIQSAELGSFTKAAEENYITATALIQQINLLEKELGFSLFARTNNGVRLTAAGENFFKAAREILSTYEHAVAQGRSVDGENRRILKVAYEPEQFPGKWIVKIAEFGRDNRCVQPMMVPVALVDQITAVKNGDVDLCMLAEPKKEYLKGCGYRNLYEETLGFCMSRDHMLAGKEMITRHDLRQETVLCGSYDYMKKSFMSVLKDCCGRLENIEGEYNMSVRMQTFASDRLFAIHYMWADQYESLLKVLPSDLSIGNVGAVYNPDKRESVMQFIEYLRNAGCFSISYLR